MSYHSQYKTTNCQRYDRVKLRKNRKMGENLRSKLVRFVHLRVYSTLCTDIELRLSTAGWSQSGEIT